MSGLMSLISNLGKNEVTQETQELMNTSKEKISELTGQESFSIWLNTDPDMANKKVAITSDAIRIDAATKLLNDQANDDWAEEKKTINDVIKWAGIGSASVTARTTQSGLRMVVAALSR